MLLDNQTIITLITKPSYKLRNWSCEKHKCYIQNMSENMFN